jgi:3-hydroxyacyl-CoA dehydrogenase
MGFLTANDKIVMNRDFHLGAAKNEVLEMAAAGFVPPANKSNCYAAGRNALAALETGLYMLEQAGYASEYDRHVAGKVAHVLCGGDLTAGQWTTEQYFLDLEREAFVSLCGELKTLERIKHILATGKPLKN